MGKGVKIFINILLGFSVVGLLGLAYYFSTITNGNKETVKDMSYNLEKSPTHYLGENVPIVVTDFSDTEAQQKNATISIKDVHLESLNENTDQIIKGQDYYLYFTIVFTPENYSIEMKENNTLGTISSDDWKYTLFIPDGENESKYIRVIKPKETVEFKFYIKTNEDVEDLGFYTSASIDKETYKNYIKLIEKD